MASIIALFIIALVSLLIVRIGAIALQMTGLSWDAASFQAYSAFFGVGFTTREAEMVVNHPVRRRIIRDLIFAGNVGLTSALATLVVTLMQTREEAHGSFWLVVLVLGLGALFIGFQLRWVRRLTDPLIRWALKGMGVVHALDYELLLRIRSGYVVSEVEVLAGSRLEGRELRDIRPKDSDVLILAIKRDGHDLTGIPCASEVLRRGDLITAYGQEESIREMCADPEEGRGTEARA